MSKLGLVLNSQRYERCTMPGTLLRVTYVVGSSHSGSTLLALLAGENPRVASVGETAIKPRIRREGRSLTQNCSCGAPLDQCQFWQRIFRRVTDEGVQFDARCWSTDYRFENRWLDAMLTRETSVFALRRLRRWASRSVPGYRDRVSRIDRANVAFVRAVLSQTGAIVFLDTTKLVTRLTHLLDIRDLDVKVVRLVRDVRGFAGSAKSRGASVVDAANVWRNDQTAILRALCTVPGERKLLLRYEDLCTETRTTLRRLWEFCDVEPVEPRLVVRSSDHHVIGNSMRMSGTIEIRLDESWRARLDDSEQRRVLEIAGTLNQQLGYV